MMKSQSSLSPIVLIVRDPVADRAGEALKEAKQLKECFICGNCSSVTVTTIPGPKKKKSQYLRQVGLFQSLLEEQAGTPTNGNESCSTCLQSVREVWKLHQEVQRIQKKIKDILDQAADLVKSRTRSDVGSPFLIKEEDLEEYDYVLNSPPCPSTPTSPEINTQKDDSNVSTNTKKRLPRRSKKKAIKFLGEVIHPSDSINTTGLGSDSEDQLEHGSVDEEEEEPPPLKRNCPSSTAAFNCSKCRKKFTSQESCMTHEVVDCGVNYEESELKILENKIISCSYPECTRKFVEKAELTRHLASDHKELQPTQFSCSKCSKIFTIKGALILHEVIVCNIPHDEVEQGQYGIVSCTYPGCGRKVARRYLYTHMKFHTDPHKCSKCSKIFASKPSLLAHEVIVCKVPHSVRKLAANGVSIRACAEPDCGKKFSTLELLRRHIRTHTGETPFKCSTCDKSFKTKSHRDYHESTTCRIASNCEITDPKLQARYDHRKACKNAYNSKRTLRCPMPYCDWRFTTQEKVQNHVQQKHNNSSATTTGRILCTICGKTMSKGSYSTHLRRVHEHEIRFNCCKCGKGFYVQAQLNRHEPLCKGKLKTRKKPNNKQRILPIKECPQCGEKFEYTQSLKKHMKTHAIVAGGVPEVINEVEVTN